MLDYTKIVCHDVSTDEYRAIPRVISVTSVEDLCKVLDVPLDSVDNTTDLTDIDDEI
jgi:hypothetical protein